MFVRVIYRAQFRTLAEVAEEELPLPSSNSLTSLLAEVARRHPNLKSMLFRPDGSQAIPLLLFVNDFPANDSRPLQAGDVVTLLAPMAGG